MLKYQIEVDVSKVPCFVKGTPCPPEAFSIVRISPNKLSANPPSELDLQNHCSHTYTQSIYSFRLDFVYGKEGERKTGAVDFTVPLSAIAYNTEVRVIQKGLFLNMTTVSICLHTS